MLAPDGTLEAAELDVAAPVEAAGADLPFRSWGEMDAPIAQQREVERARSIGSGGVPPLFVPVMYLPERLRIEGSWPLASALVHRELGHGFANALQTREAAISVLTRATRRHDYWVCAPIQGKRGGAMVHIAPPPNLVFRSSGPCGGLFSCLDASLGLAQPVVANGANLVPRSLGVPRARAADRPRSPAVSLHDMAVAVEGERRRVVPGPLAHDLHFVSPLEEERHAQVAEVVWVERGDPDLSIKVC